MVDHQYSAPKIAVLLLGSTLPCEYEQLSSVAWKANTKQSQMAFELLTPAFSKADPMFQTNLNEKENGSELEKEIQRVKYLQQEFLVFKHSYPTMTFVECAPTLTSDGEGVKYPTKQDYINKIREVLAHCIQLIYWNLQISTKTRIQMVYSEVINISHGRQYFGLYYTGVTDVHSGNWVVLNDSPKKQSKNDLYQNRKLLEDCLTCISIEDVFKVVEETGFKGQTWWSLDGPGCGKWVHRFARKEIKLYGIWNVLIDAVTDHYGPAYWLCYISRLFEQRQHLWLIHGPICYNESFPCVVWPDNLSTKIPTKALYKWLSWQKNQQMTNAEQIED